jgi:hypothetical protein
MDECLSASGPTKIGSRIFVGHQSRRKHYHYFRRPIGRRKYVHVFSSAIKADENTAIFFDGYLGRRKYVFVVFLADENSKKLYFRRQPTKKRLFSSILFCRPNFVGRPAKIAIFNVFRPIFIDFLLTKIHYFPVVSMIHWCQSRSSLVSSHVSTVCMYVHILRGCVIKVALVQKPSLLPVGKPP